MYGDEDDAIKAWNTRNYLEKQDSSNQIPEVVENGNCKYLELLDYIKFCRNASAKDIKQIHDRARDLIAEHKECCKKSCKDENATCKKNLRLTRSDIEKIAKLNYHEYKEPRYYYVGETDSIAGMYFKIKIVDGSDDLTALAIELYKEDEDGSIDFLTDYQTIHSAIKAAEEWLVNLICSALRVEEKIWIGNLFLLCSLDYQYL